MFGSDYPHSPENIVIKKKKHFDENSDYDGVREQIYSENASALLDRQEER